MRRYLPILILLAFLVVYLEWSGGNSGFIFQLEYEVFTKDFSLHTIFHPLILFPLVGQLVLLISLFFKKSRRLVITSILLLSILVLMVLLVGILSLHWKIILSTLPYLGLSVYYVLSGWKKKAKE
jgi:hypothetical protein